MDSTACTVPRSLTPLEVSDVLEVEKALVMLPAGNMTTRRMQFQRHRGVGLRIFYVWLRFILHLINSLCYLYSILIYGNEIVSLTMKHKSWIQTATRTLQQIIPLWSDSINSACETLYHTIRCICIFCILSILGSQLLRMYNSFDSPIPFQTKSNSQYGPLSHSLIPKLLTMPMQTWCGASNFGWSSRMEKWQGCISVIWVFKWVWIKFAGLASYRK